MSGYDCTDWTEVIPLHLVAASCDGARCTVKEVSNDTDEIIVTVIANQSGLAVLRVNAEEENGDASYTDEYQLEFSEPTELVVSHHILSDIALYYAVFPGARFSWNVTAFDSKKREVALSQNAIEVFTKNDAIGFLPSDIVPGPKRYSNSIILEALDVGIGEVEIRLSSLIRILYVRVVDPNEVSTMEIHEISNVRQTYAYWDSDDMWMNVEADPFPDTKPISFIRLEEQSYFRTFFCLLFLPDGTQVVGGFEGLRIEPEGLARLGAIGGRIAADGSSTPPMATAFFALHDYQGGEGLLRASIGHAQMELPIGAVSSTVDTE
jgi:hypothetical protein